MNEIHDCGNMLDPQKLKKLKGGEKRNEMSLKFHSLSTKS
jgi:hypothetical protein